MIEYYNPNPRNRKIIGDCAVRSIAKALNISWETAYIDLVTKGYEMADMPSSNEVISAYLYSKGFRKYIIPNSCPDCYSAEMFAEDYPIGTFILGTGSHLLTVVDGIIYDAWDSSDVVPLYYYEKERY